MKPIIVSCSAADSVVGRAAEGAVYHGVLRRIPRDQYGGQAVREWELSTSELDALLAPLTLSDAVAEPLPGAAIERVVTIDHATGDFIVLWRVAFRKVEP
jgi:hypothetical protein